MNPRWRSAAACRGIGNPELFFPAEDDPGYAAQVTAAKAICARCPVRPDCLTEALSRIPFGVAGGLTAAERRALPRPVSRDEREAAGRVLLAAGRSQREIAVRCGVTERTVARWAARARALISIDPMQEGTRSR